MTLSTKQARDYREAVTMLQSIAADIHSQWCNWLDTVPASTDDWTPEQDQVHKAYCALLGTDSPDESISIEL